MLRTRVLFLAFLRLSRAFLELKLLVSRFIPTDVGFVFDNDDGFTPFSLLKSACQTSVRSSDGCKDSPPPGTFLQGAPFRKKVRRQI